MPPTIQLGKRSFIDSASYIYSAIIIAQDVESRRGPNGRRRARSYFDFESAGASPLPKFLAR